MSASNGKYNVVVVGGGAGGLSVAAALRRKRPTLDVAIVEPSEKHYYQPGWTLVGGGSMTAAQTMRYEGACIPAGATWLRESVVSFEPESNQVMLSSGEAVSYDYLVVAAGLQLDWDKIDGLPAALGKNGVTSNYRFDLAPYTWQCLREFTGGRALFTQPAMPIKCAGAPQKILYLAADYWRQQGTVADIQFFNQGGAMFGVPLFARALDQIMTGYGAKPRFGQNLIGVDGKAKTATFQLVSDGSTVTESFDLLHVTPPQSAPDFIKTSPLAAESGWMDVDRHTLRHTRYANIFGLGDCTNTPNAKTAAAVRRQFPVVVANLLAVLDSRDNTGDLPSYDGYGGCPLTVAYGKVMMAEFRYDAEVVPSFPLDPRVPRRSYWWMKRSLFPYMYWNVILRGRDWHWPAPRPRYNSVP